ncbi:MAG: glycogen/starch/alpha-glucan family phosphorylase [Clostridia bacterium]|nr:glycogen/starch/alpha-glucan family phosphorylase [Clostridia bacterium]
MNASIQLDAACKERYGRSLQECSDAEIYTLLHEQIKEMLLARRAESASPKGKRRLYYLCAEFLIGRTLRDHMISLGVYEGVREQLFAAGRDPDLIEQKESEPSLGNGGLGRLAACFLDSVAALGLPGDGVGLLYRFGLFKQVFSHLQQREIPDPWLDAGVIMEKAAFEAEVTCMGVPLRARMYDVAIPGPAGSTTMLHLFEPQSICEDAVKEQDGIGFDMKDIAHHLTLFLYPDDSRAEGRRLRLCQQYFLACCAAAWILQDCGTRGWRCGETPLSDYAAVQINDTHPALIIPVLIDALSRRGLSVADAIEQVRTCCAYTNHTVLSEALECWPMGEIQTVAPNLVPLLQQMDATVEAWARERGMSADGVRLIRDGRLSMANLAVHFSSHVNGVAALHTALLQKQVLPELYAWYPERFSNKTNGITHRRWLLGCNRPLSRWIRRHIGDAFEKDASQLAALSAYENDPMALEELLHIKAQNKQRLCAYLARTRGIVLMPEAVFDVQVKRLHEYKRQHLSALYLIDELLDLREGKALPVPMAAIYGAKAAPSYEMAKDILHLLLCLQQITRQDEYCRGMLQVAVVENYNVEAAEYIMPAADISEQISLASKEASGTGNMKMMMNGALTLGTEDGANIEIMQRVGRENMFLFGLGSREVVELEASQAYRPQKLYEQDARLARAVDFIVSEEMVACGDRTRLQRLHDALLQYDRFMSFADVDAYRRCRDGALQAYPDRMSWAKKMLINISRSGYFSSDRTVLEYNRDIWHLQREGE